MLGGRTAVLVRPREAIASRRGSLGGPAAVVFALGVVAVGGALIPGLVIVRERLPALLPDSPPVALVTGDATVAVPSLFLQIMVLSLALPFAGWVLTAAVLHALLALASTAARARGDRVRPTRRPSRAWLARRVGAFRQSLVAVGWGYLPQVFASLATATLFAAAYLSDPDLAVRTVTLTPAGHAVVDLPGRSSLTAATRVVGAASVLWTAFVWVGALRATRGASRRVALAAVLPVALVLLYASDLVGYLGLVG